ncbi:MULTISPECIES: carbohydrate ABC transporter permease [Microbacterium]|uniref:Carbohydrate ABC transporter permease n=1 Tax=Microbacterium galbinum TaxID=2851646 RepID=A0ABY4IMM3_9MICO|nr:carbohydrate ABC transporter permease [Microbacterium galbinum]MBQ3359655.1 carbohydrate ABC transporter permease [Microbacterium sp.]MCK2023719.1 carbohydrate ABC transporter permease [Microbacterium galbinum]MCK2030415.1 carbohydrate ABC transporter permease [Microbacterium galbinum]UPL13869.1 carbohydrate ABC transporter permease [Microbacterium galbinum]
MTTVRIPTDLPRRRGVAAKFGSLGKAALITLLVVFAGFPVYWMLSTSLGTEASLYGGSQPLVPEVQNIGQWGGFLADIPIFRWLGNSFVIAAGTTILSLVLATMAAYALSRYKFHGRGVAGFIFFSTQMLPEALIIVPLYAIFAGAGLLNSHWGLVLADTAFVMPVAMFIIKSGIDKIPYEIEESARIDGCSRLRILTTIVLPLVMPSIAAASVIAFFDGWNEFMFANTFISSSDLWPASVGLSSFLGQFYTPMNVVMFCALLFALPAIIFFLWAQRGIVSGLTAGSVKG